MSGMIALTERGREQANHLVTAYLLRRGLPADTVSTFTAEQALEVLLAYGARMTEGRTEAWLAAQFDRILGLEVP